MFGFSIGKLLVLGLIVLVVWYGFKWIGAAAGATKKPGAARRRNGSEPDSLSEPRDLAGCPRCGTYVAPELARCPAGRADCPMLSDEAGGHR